MGYSFKFSIGILPWPLVFISTDLINEYFGPGGVRKLSLITACLIIYAFIVLYISMNVPAANFSPVQDEEFSKVFGQSMYIIVGSVTAFLISQAIDAFIFGVLKSKTGTQRLWLRATGSTVFSQLIDSFVVLGIGFLLPGKIGLGDYIQVGLTNYSGKLIIAILLTPFIYAAHSAINRFLLAAPE